MKNPILITLLLGSCLNMTASPRIESDSISLRHEMTMMRDSDGIDSAILTWPWPLGRDTTINRSETTSSIADTISGRFEEIHSTDSKLGLHASEISLSIASDSLPFRSFGSQPRENLEASFSQSWLSEWFAGNINISHAGNALDGDDLRVDGSYLAVALGNWSFGIDQVDRWWGPGWDGSLILSNSARPVPALSLTRISPEPFPTKWLKWIGPWTFNTFMGQLENDEGDRPGSNARLFGMRIDFSPFAWENLDIGLSRTAQWAGDRRPGDLNTFWRLLTGEDNRVNGVTLENEPGNQLAGIDYRLRIPNTKLAQYTQLTGEDEETFLPDANMLLAGIEAWGSLPSHNATWRAYFEWADTRAGYLRRDPSPNRDFNIAYNHDIYHTGYRYKGSSIGHAMDGDGVMRSVGAILVTERGDLSGAKIRNYSINRDGVNPRTPHSISENPLEGWSLEFFAEIDATESPLNFWGGGELKVNFGLHYIDERNVRTGAKEDSVGGHLSLTKKL